jgi:hypothetical protein
MEEEFTTNISNVYLLPKERRNAQQESQMYIFFQKRGGIHNNNFHIF